METNYALNYVDYKHIAWLPSQDQRGFYVSKGKVRTNMSRVHDALRLVEQTGPPASLLTDLESEHWLRTFMEDLLVQFRTSGEINFETVRRLLEQHEQAFLKDLETARKMYRTYPHLFPVEAAKRVGAT